MSPPSWADALLRLALPRADQDSISGDLLEEYRQEIVRTKGRAAADLWYVVQVFGYVWRATRLGALVFSGAFLTRTVWDWLVPTPDFTTRSAVTTSVAIGTLAFVGFRAAFRSESILSGIVLAGLTSQMAAVLSALGVASVLLLWHDAATIRAIDGSGGLGEAFSLPFMTLFPAVLLGAISGVCGRVMRRLIHAA